MKNNREKQTYEEILEEKINVLADILKQIPQNPYIDIIELNKHKR